MILVVDDPVDLVMGGEEAPYPEICIYKFIMIKVSKMT